MMSPTPAYPEPPGLNLRSTRRFGNAFEFMKAIGDHEFRQWLKSEGLNLPSQCQMVAADGEETLEMIVKRVRSAISDGPAPQTREAWVVVPDEEAPMGWVVFKVIGVAN